MSIEKLKPYRAQIDALDDQILALLKQRFDIVENVIKVKMEHGIPASLQDRVDEVHDRNVATAQKLGLPEQLVSDIYAAIIGQTCAYEADIMPHDDNAGEHIPSKRRAS